MGKYIYSATNITCIETPFLPPTPPDMARKCDFYLDSCTKFIGTITGFCPNIQSYVGLALTIFSKEQSVYVSDGSSYTYIGMVDTIVDFNLPFPVASTVLKEAFKYLKGEDKVDLYTNPRGTLVKFVGNKCASLYASKRY